MKENKKEQLVFFNLTKLIFKLNNLLFLYNFNKFSFCTHYEIKTKSWGLNQTKKSPDARPFEESWKKLF